MINTNHELKVKANATYINIEDAQWLSLNEIAELKEAVDATFTKDKRNIIVPGYDYTFEPIVKTFIKGEVLETEIHLGYQKGYFIADINGENKEKTFEIGFYMVITSRERNSQYKKYFAETTLFIPLSEAFNGNIARAWFKQEIYK